MTGYPGDEHTWSVVSLWFLLVHQICNTLQLAILVSCSWAACFSVSLDFCLHPFLILVVVAVICRVSCKFCKFWAHSPDVPRKRQRKSCCSCKADDTPQKAHWYTQQIILIKEYLTLSCWFCFQIAQLCIHPSAVSSRLEEHAPNVQKSFENSIVRTRNSHKWFATSHEGKKVRYSRAAGFYKN